MKQSFEKPVFEVIHFTQNIISASGCNCDIGGFEMPGCNDNICISINTYCDCQTNTTDPNAANCITPVPTPIPEP